jgi:peroxiredoxin
MRFPTLAAGVAVLAASAFAAEIPRKAPEFVVQLPQGGQKLLSDYRGKVVCIEFLYTTCPHCQQSSQFLSQMQSQYGPKGFQALGVAFNQMSKMLVPDFVRDFKVNFPVGYAERDPVQNFLQVPFNEALHVPQLVFIDRKGMIRKQSLPRGDAATGDPANVRRMIEQLLAEPASTTAKPARTSKKSS